MFEFLFKKKYPSSPIQSCSLIDLSTETSNFFQELTEEFSFLLFDEILILRKLPWWYELVHHQEYSKQAQADKNWRDRVIGNIDLFLSRIIKKNALSDGEWVFTWDQYGALFDVMVREGDYYIVLNNSGESLSDLMKNHPFNESKLIRFLAKFARRFSNSPHV